MGSRFGGLIYTRSVTRAFGQTWAAAHITSYLYTRMGRGGWDGGGGGGVDETVGTRRHEFDDPADLGDTC